LKLGFVGQNEDLLRRNEALKAVDRFFDESLVVKETEELLGAGVAAQRPETGSAASCEDEGVKIVCLGHGGIGRPLLVRLGQAAGQYVWDGNVQSPLARLIQFVAYQDSPRTIAPFSVASLSRRAFYCPGLGFLPHWRPRRGWACRVFARCCSAISQYL